MTTAATTPSASVGSSSPLIGGQASSSTPRQSKEFDVVAAYHKALTEDKYPHPIAAIMALTELMEASTASTISGLTMELRNGRQHLIQTQTSLGVRAGCQLWERFVAVNTGGEDFMPYKRNLIAQGRTFCQVTAPNSREKIAKVAVDFLRDDCVILTHSCSRTVIQTILRAHKQHKRVSVYVTEARPGCLGLRTHQILTAAGIPCTVVLDSAVGYIMERVDMVLVGCEAVVESGALVSSVGTSQVALVAKALQKPVYALAESYKFLRYYPLSQTDLPMPQQYGDRHPLSFPTELPAMISNFPATTPSHSRRASVDPDLSIISGAVSPVPGTPRSEQLKMTKEMVDNQPNFDITYPELVDFIITDLGSPLSPTSVSQYLVAQFSA